MERKAVDFPILGFDTATPATAVCVLGRDGDAHETDPPGAGWEGRPPAHAGELLPEVVRLLRAGGLVLEDVRAIAVGIGPGTFTGLRIGVATARALAQALGIELRPVSTLDALAEGMAGQAGPQELLLPVIDAKRGEVFAALYSPGPGGIRRIGGEVVAPPGGVVVAASELTAASGPSTATSQPAAATSQPTAATSQPAAGRAILAAGDGAIRFCGELQAAGVRVAPAGSGFHAVRAFHVCRLAMAVDAVDPQGVEPNYLRLPDAEAALRHRSSR